ncbi:MAG TPA: hypothetical protein VKE24_13505 [Candidatus Acidoferrales bacterium]|nr:hypothetical protein [Candidatus Acidoferrales bacterium]
MAHATGHSAYDIGVVLIVVGDSIIYGFFSFLILRVQRTALS